MNKQIIELKEQRASKIEEMNAILAVCKEEKRKRSEEEDVTFKNLDSEIGQLDAQIVEAERMEELNKSIARQSKMKEEEKIVKRFDLSKAIQQFKRGALDGVEREMHEEGLRNFVGETSGLIIPEMLIKRADVTMTTHATDIETKVAGLDVIAPPSLYGQLGSTIWSGLKAKTVLNFSDGQDSTFIAEEGNSLESSPTRATDSLEPRRVGGQKIFTNEQLSVSAVMATEFADMVASIDRAISKEMLSKAVSANVLSGHATTDVGAALTYAVVLKLFQGLEDGLFVKPALVASKPIYHKLEGTEVVSGAGRFVVEGGKMNGELIYGTNHLPIHDTTKYDILYGDFSRSYIGFFGSGVELLIDPYTSGTAGKTKIIWSRLADVAVNPSAFASIRNAIV